MSTEPVRFPFVRLPGALVPRPMLWLSLGNLHNPDVKDVMWPALIDTGADSSLAPRGLCAELGHVFDAGTSPSSASGVGAGSVRTFKHATRITTLVTPQTGEEPDRNNTVFFPIDLPLGCIEQDLHCVLLGQSDFLNLFEFTQNRSEGWFSLRRL